MAWLRILLLVFPALLSACTFAVLGKENFLREAHQKAGQFPVAYQSLYKCFVDRSTLGTGGMPFAADGPRAELYPDLGLGEYKLGQRDAWFMLVEFRRVSASSTEVRVYDLRKGWLDDNWHKVEACAQTEAAHLDAPAQR